MVLAALGARVEAGPGRGQQLVYAGGPLPEVLGELRRGIGRLLAEIYMMLYDPTADPEEGGARTAFSASSRRRAPTTQR